MKVLARSEHGRADGHLLSKLPYEELPREKIELPKRQKRGDYEETQYAFKYVEEKF